MENDIFFLGVDQEVPVLGADGAVAADYFGGGEGGEGDAEDYLAAVAVCLVGFEGGGHLGLRVVC